jgi:hypothetical protein
VRKARFVNRLRDLLRLHNSLNAPRRWTPAEIMCTLWMVIIGLPGGLAVVSLSFADDKEVSKVVRLLVFVLWLAILAGLGYGLWWARQRGKEGHNNRRAEDEQTLHSEAAAISRAFPDLVQVVGRRDTLLDADSVMGGILRLAHGKDEVYLANRAHRKPFLTAAHQGHVLEVTVKDNQFVIYYDDKPVVSAPLLVFPDVNAQEGGENVRYKFPPRNQRVLRNGLPVEDECWFDWKSRR